MTASRAFSLVIPLVLWGGGAADAQTVQQDRRIEEEKRDSLRPTTTLLPVPSRLVAPTEPPVPPPIKELYLAGLISKRVAFGYDAAKAIVILMGVDEEYIDLAAQVAYLRDNGMLPKRAQGAFDPMQPLRKGLAAYLFCRALKVPGGVAWHLFGPTQRYALKEMVFRGWMPPGQVSDLVNGAELVQLMNQAAQHRVKQLANRRP